MPAAQDHVVRRRERRPAALARPRLRDQRGGHHRPDAQRLVLGSRFEVMKPSTRGHFSVGLAPGCFQALPASEKAAPCLLPRRVANRGRLGRTMTAVCYAIAMVCARPARDFCAPCCRQGCIVLGGGLGAGTLSWLASARRGCRPTQIAATAATRCAPTARSAGGTSPATPPCSPSRPRPGGLRRRLGAPEAVAGETEVRHLLAARGRQTTREDLARARHDGAGHHRRRRNTRSEGKHDPCARAPPLLFECPPESQLSRVAAELGIEAILFDATERRRTAGSREAHSWALGLARAAQRTGRKTCVWIALPCTAWSTWQRLARDPNAFARKRLVWYSSASNLGQTSVSFHNARVSYDPV